MTHTKTALLISIVLSAALAFGFGLGPIVLWFCGIDVFDTAYSKQVERARADIAILEQAVVCYHQEKGWYPDTLYQMTSRDNSGMYFLKDPKVLIDPWGHYYDYDPARINPATGKPLIWSSGSPARHKPITNWD